MIRLLSSGKIGTIRDLHELLNKQALAKGEQIEKEVSTTCPGARDCLLRFIIAIGKGLGLTDKEVYKETGCDALLDPVGFRRHAGTAKSRRRHGS
jgi:hypothetical protein